MIPALPSNDWRLVLQVNSPTYGTNGALALHAIKETSTESTGVLCDWNFTKPHLRAISANELC